MIVDVDGESLVSDVLPHVLRCLVRMEVESDFISCIPGFKDDEDRKPKTEERCDEKLAKKSSVLTQMLDKLFNYLSSDVESLIIKMDEANAIALKRLKQPKEHPKIKQPQVPILTMPPGEMTDALHEMLVASNSTLLLRIWSHLLPGEYTVA